MTVAVPLSSAPTIKAVARNDITGLPIGLSYTYQYSAKQSICLTIG